MRGSLVGSNEPKTHFIEGLIGLAYEEMESNSKPVHTMEATENKYTVLVYFRPFGARADELLGIAEVNSRLN